MIEKKITLSLSHFNALISALIILIIIIIVIASIFMVVYIEAALLISKNKTKLNINIS